MKKKLILLFLCTFVLNFLFAVPDPSVIWPNYDNYYVAAGTDNQVYQVQAHEKKCYGFATFYSVNETTGVKTLIEQKTYYAEKDWSHVRVLFNMPSCPISNKYCVGFRNSKDGNLSNEVFRYVKTSEQKIGVTSAVPILKYKCNGDLWDPVQPLGAQRSYTSLNTSVNHKYYGTTNYFNLDQNHLIDAAIYTSTDGSGFSPYMIQGMNFNQQHASGTYQYSIPTPPCDEFGTNTNSISFLRLDVNYGFDQVPDFEGKIINPDDLFCSNYIGCALPGITFYPFFAPSELNLPSGTDIHEVKYYYVDNDGNRHENERMTTNGATSRYGNLVYRKKVCFDDLKNINGVPEECNYVIVYTVKVIVGVNPQSSNSYIYEYCDIEFDYKVSPVNNPSNVTASDALSEITNRYNDLRNQLIDLPGMTEEKICELVFGLVGVIHSDFLFFDEVISLRNVKDGFGLDSLYSVFKRVASNHDAGVMYNWKHNGVEVRGDLDLLFLEKGKYELFVSNKSGMSFKVYSLKICQKSTDAKAALSDIVNSKDYLDVLRSINIESRQEEFFAKPRSELGSKRRKIFNDLEVKKNNIDIVELRATFLVVPNPSKDRIRITTDDKTGLINVDRVIIQNSKGKSLIDLHMNLSEMNNNSIDISKFEKGIYFVTILRNNEFINRVKFVKI